MTGAEPTPDRSSPVVHERVVDLSPLVRRITQNNPGLFTGPGTNTHLVGRSALVILDPGEVRDDGHLERIVAAVGDVPVQAVIPSHGHPDHWPLAPALARALDAPIRFYGEYEGLRPDRPIGDGEEIDLGGISLRTLHTPGHTRDHLSFHLPAEGALFPGDHVMGWSTSIIIPPDGSLTEYLGSLDRLIAIPDLEVLYPAHGPAVLTPYERMRELRAHRLERTRQALAALGAGPDRIGALVERIYTDTDPKLYPAAARSLQAHLLALEEAGEIEREPASRSAAWTDVVWRLRR